jgi:hypothetical protein
MAFDTARAVNVVFGGSIVDIGGSAETWELGVFCYADCDGTTVPSILSANDFVCFLNRFVAGSPYANCDGSTTPPILSANDFQCFLKQFAAGCT